MCCISFPLGFLLSSSWSKQVAEGGAAFYAEEHSYQRLEIVIIILGILINLCTCLGGDRPKGQPRQGPLGLTLPFAGWGRHRGRIQEEGLRRVLDEGDVEDNVVCGG